MEHLKRKRKKNQTEQISIDKKLKKWASDIVPIIK